MRARDRSREITRRDRDIGLDRMIRELRSYLSGWVIDFRPAASRTHRQDPDGTP